LDDHVKSKVHKKRVKLAAEKPYSQAEANAAAGMGATKKD
jgi:bud site selection protein 20